MTWAWLHQPVLWDEEEGVHDAQARGARDRRRWRDGARADHPSGRARELRRPRARRAAARPRARALLRGRPGRRHPRPASARPAPAASSRSRSSSTWPRSSRPGPSSSPRRRTRSTSRARSTCSASPLEEARSHGRPVKFLFPSSIAVYGLPDSRGQARGRARRRAPVARARDHVRVQQALLRSTSGATSRATIASSPRRHGPSGVDFRALRFPGLISAFTLPSGGTSDYAPEMVHAAAQGRPYACFVREDTRIPFMAMPDAIDALCRPAGRARGVADDGLVYNVGAPSTRAPGELAGLVRAAFPGRAADASRPIRAGRPSWTRGPRTWTTRRARRDWGFRPAHDLDRAFDEYLLPNVSAATRRAEQARRGPVTEGGGATCTAR